MISEIPRPEANFVLVKRHSGPPTSENTFVQTTGRSHSEKADFGLGSEGEEAWLAYSVALIRDPESGCNFALVDGDVKSACSSPLDLHDENPNKDSDRLEHCCFRVTTLCNVRQNNSVLIVFVKLSIPKTESLQDDADEHSK